MPVLTNGCAEMRESTTEQQMQMSDIPPFSSTHKGHTGMEYLCMPLSYCAILGDIHEWGVLTFARVRWLKIVQLIMLHRKEERDRFLLKQIRERLFIRCFSVC